MTLDLAFGVDVNGGVLDFYVQEGSGLEVGGVEVVGAVDANLGIRNLLDVDVSGPINGSLSGGIAFVDPDPDDKLRIDQLSSPADFLSETINGTLLFAPEFVATLPVIGELPWSGRFGVEYANGTSSSIVELAKPSTDFVRTLIENGFQTIAGAFDLFGGSDVDSDLPVVDKGIGEILGLPDLGGLGGGVSIPLADAQLGDLIDDLIQGNPVDLIRFEISGGDTFSEDFRVLLAAAAVPIGPVPLTLSLSFITEIEAGWSYYVGMGVDTVGFYIDPATSIAASGSILAGLLANVSIAGIAGMEIDAGVGASLSMSVGLNDPDPSDGRIYLDELLTHRDSSLGDSLLNVLEVGLGGEAFGYARGVVYFLFLGLGGIQ